MDKKILLILLILCGCQRKVSANCEIDMEEYNLQIALSAINNQITDIDVITRINGDIFRQDKDGLDHYFSVYSEYYQSVVLDGGDLVLKESFDMSDREDIIKVSSYILSDHEFFSLKDTLTSLTDDGFICVENMLK